MDYLQALGYLETLIALGVKTGLDHTRHLAARLGDPQTCYPSILVTGTNGKGSTSSFLAGILEASGLRVGLYTSPHLVDVRERIRVGEELVSREAFASCLTRVREAAEAAVAEGDLSGPPTYFEALTLLAFDHFRRLGVDVAVLEIGLGGRLDCTNIVEPELSIVTNIALDHEEYLGHGLENIAREKAGVFRPGVPALTAAQGVGLETLRARAGELGVPLMELRGEHVAVSGERFRFDWGEWHLELPRPSLAGDHQVPNAALAVLAGHALRDRGWPVSDEAMAEGVSSASWPGRLELLARGPDLYLDGAHNVAGCEALAAFVEGLPRAPKALVFTAMKDKPVGEMLGALAPHFGALWATRVPMPRCTEPSEILAHAHFPEAHAEPEPLEALAQARRWAGPDGVVVVAGSLYLAGYIKSMEEGVLSRSWGSGL
jgi:dihydrofolate synthase / folylpolyglutamate synthase